MTNQNKENITYNAAVYSSICVASWNFRVKNASYIRVMNKTVNR